jgi:hypothetical protein
MGEGTCCGNGFYGDLMTGERETFCALYNSPMGEFDEMFEEIYPEYAMFTSARPMDGKGGMEGGLMEQAEGWYEETFGESANEMITAIASLVTVAAMNA